MYVAATAAAEPGLNPRPVFKQAQALHPRQLEKLYPRLADCSWRPNIPLLEILNPVSSTRKDSKPSKRLSTSKTVIQTSSRGVVIVGFSFFLCGGGGGGGSGLLGVL